MDVYATWGVLGGSSMLEITKNLSDLNKQKDCKQIFSNFTSKTFTGVVFSMGKLILIKSTCNIKHDKSSTAEICHINYLVPNIKVIDL